MYYISSTKYTIQERNTKKNGRVYDVVFRITDEEGITKQKKLSGYKTKTDAKIAYTDFITENCNKKPSNFKPAEIKKEEKPLMFDELFKLYLQTQRNQIKDSSIRSIQDSCKLLLFPFFRDVDIRKLTKKDILKWQDTIWSMQKPNSNEHYSYNYLTKIRSFFNAFLNWAEQRYDVNNYLSDIPKPKRRTAKTEMQIWTREEFEQFISVVDDPMYHCLFSFLFFTGKRKGEILALQKDDVKGGKIKVSKNLNRKTIDNTPYQITSTKADKIQTITLCEPLIKELKSYQGQEPFFFGGEKPIAYTTLHYKFHKYIELAGVKKIRIHDLRHSFASMCIHLGANLTVVADLLCDNLEQVTKTYAHMYVEDKEEIIRRIK